MHRLVPLLLFISALDAADDPLTAIHAFLVPMRTAPVTEARGATPALTEVKHRLRDWVESRLAGLQWKDGRWTLDPTVFQEQLNQEVDRAGLLCGQNESCVQNPLGYLGRIEFRMESDLLVVRTCVGVQICGTDDSAYIYE